MTFDLETIVQVLLLSVGVHVFLSFLRTTRGSGMIRGVVIALFVVFGALLGVAKWLGLEELEFIVRSITGFAVVILAIVFQPELRRGIVSLGDNPLLRRVIRTGSADAVEEVAAACVSMAKRNQGALIAFEREASLDPWIQTSQRIDARVNRFLLDSIFHTGTALHDGAVMIREDRIASAGAILPLSENERLAQSVGTRHRAALGLTEETDAVVVAVSEETGLITVCQDGKMERRVLKDELANVLRARLGGGEDATGQGDAGFFASTVSGLRSTAASIVSHPGQKLLALAFGLGLYTLAFRQVRTTHRTSVAVRAEPRAGADLAPHEGVLRILLPNDDLQLLKPNETQRIYLVVNAPQAQIPSIERRLGGVLEVDESWLDQDRPIKADEIAWGVGRVLGDLDVQFDGSESIMLSTEEYATEQVAPTPEAVLGTHPDGRPYLTPPTAVVLDTSSLEFNPASVEVRGPSAAVQRLLAEPERLVFEPVDLSGESGSGFVVELELDPRENGDVRLTQQLFLRGSLSPRETLVGQVELDVALVSFVPGAGDPAALFEPPTEQVTVVVRARGLLPDDLDPALQTAMTQEILGFVRENARVYVDVTRVAEASTSRATVEIDLPDDYWKERLGDRFASAKANPDASLTLEIDEADKTVALIQR